MRFVPRGLTAWEPPDDLVGAGGGELACCPGTVKQPNSPRSNGVARSPLTVTARQDALERKVFVQRRPVQPEGREALTPADVRRLPRPLPFVVAVDGGAELATSLAEGGAHGFWIQVVTLSPANPKHVPNGSRDPRDVFERYYAVRGLSEG